MTTTSPLYFAPAVLLVALSLSIGWGVRGNWGHEYGAMIPGALAAMAAVIVSRREDWHRRIGLFAFYGAVGWSFGGSISYMQVIGYTHSGHWDSVLYGFACLFVIGFIWAALGGAGTALPAFLERERLTALLVPTFVVFLAWGAQGIFFHYYFAPLREQLAAGQITEAAFDAESAWADWYDTDWIAAGVALAAAGLLALVQRQISWGVRLVLYLGIGWWIGFLLLTVTLGLRMTPPRGDNWSGALGMTCAMFLFFCRERLWGIVWVALIVGLFGGLGFSGATLIKLVLIHPGFQDLFFGEPISSNWHSILEQSFGFISGIGVAVAVAYVATWAERQNDERQSAEPRLRAWADPVTILFVLLVVTYVNISKNLSAVWLTKESRTLPETMWGLASQHWFDVAYLALALTIAIPLAWRMSGREVALLPSSRLGKAQLLYVVFLWWIVVGNLSRTVPFQEQRLITEGVIHIHACLCTVLVLLLPGQHTLAAQRPAPDLTWLVRRSLLACLIVGTLAIVGEFAVIQGLWRDEYAGARYGGLHIRFGPDKTVDKK